MKEIQQSFIVRLRGKKWRLPLVLPFWTGNIVKRDFRFYDVLDFRPPRKGEFYLSGSPIEVWRALADHGPNDPFLIVAPTDKAEMVCRWEKAGGE